MSLEPDQPTWAIGYGAVLLAQRRYADAARVHRQALEHAAKRYELLVGLSVALRGTKSGYDAAQRAISTALATSPQRAPAYYEAGLLASATGREEDARRHLRRFVELAKDDPSLSSARERAEQLLEAR